DCERIAEEVRRASARWRRVGRTNTHHIRLHVPVRSPTVGLKRLERRYPRIPAEDSGQLPVAQNGVGYLVHVPAEMLAPTERNSNEPVGVDDMAHVEV